MVQARSGARTTLMFLHGAGGFEEDGTLATRLAKSIDAELLMPRMSDEDMSVESWAAPIRHELADLGHDDLVVAHSFGASILVKVLAERVWQVRRAHLLAMPNWGQDGWEVEEYDFDGPEPPQSLTLHHCRDDAVVPFAHLALNARTLPGARVEAHSTGGHQFEDEVPDLLGS
ncbi:alpha/beta hydrolase [Microbacterium abyssi]|uniref:alpha/beta hydrolase n=1 Tax=Microbacterium abyssi TaxID=2782166 RepID=UPI0018897160|nr:alpha/beta hydrolase [Microbacterium sp. A18JL241]